MSLVLKGAALIAVMAVATPSWAQMSEELNRAELCRIAVAHAAPGTPPLAAYPCSYPYVWAAYPYPYAYAYPYLYPYATPTAYPGPNSVMPFVPAEIVKGVGGSWRWENHAYQWHPDNT
jgi:hypothetical protein